MVLQTVEGFLIAVKNQLEYKILSTVVDDSGGRYIILHIEIQRFPYIMLTYYAPNVENEQFRILNKLYDELDKLPLREDQDVYFVFEGDFNLIFDKSLDAFSVKVTLRKNPIVKLKSLMGKLDLIDIWRL